MPEFISPFVLKWVQGMNQGEWEEETNDLELLIGHKPMTPAEYLQELADAALTQEKAS
jgi:NAD(P)H dehydrogenase (quinone)